MYIFISTIKLFFLILWHLKQLLTSHVGREVLKFSTVLKAAKYKFSTNTALSSKKHLNTKKHYKDVTRGRLGVAEVGGATLAGNYSSGKPKVDWALNTLFSQSARLHVDISNLWTTWNKTVNLCDPAHCKTFFFFFYNKNNAPQNSIPANEMILSAPQW